MAYDADTPDLFDAQYPHAPGYQDRDTSMEAAEAMKPRAPSIRQLVLDALALQPMASFEIAPVIGKTYAATQPRTSELVRQSKIVDSGERRVDPATGKRAIVWRLV